MKCWFHPEARTESIEAASYYERQRPGLGLRFLDAVDETIRRVQAHPFMYRVVSDVWRQCRVSRFPFGVIYRTTDRGVEIIAVMHLHRKPDYWRHRITDH